MAAPTTEVSIDDIPGWFPWMDQRVFEHFLSGDAVVPRGDLVELGVYLGKSATLIGRFKAPDETFTVCDLFGGEAGDASNSEENSRHYRDLSRLKFEQHYLSVHSELPVVIQDLSSAIVDHVRPSSARFVHVDASHLYEHVVTDVASARTMLVPDGVVVFDDFRGAHTPGVSAAVWEAIFTKGLHVICMTAQKLYATFGDAGPHQERLVSWLSDFGKLSWETQMIGGAEVVRIKQPPRAGRAKPRDVGGPATTRDVDRLAAQVGKLAKAVDSVAGKVSTVSRDVAELKAAQHRGVGHRLRRAPRAVRAKLAQ